MRRVQPFLQREGYKTSLISLKGGLPTTESIEELQSKLTDTCVEPGTAVVFDILGNFTFRYEQEDGGMSLPVPIQGVHHLFGKVGVCTDDMLKCVVAKLVPVLGKLRSVPRFVMPTPPRYLKVGCCVEKTHAINAGLPGENLIMVEKLMHLRKLLRSELAGSSTTGYWVPEIVESLSTPAVGTAGSLTDRVENLTELFASDCVHLTSVGYTRLAGCIADSVKLATKKRLDTANCCVSGMKKTFFWRGFSSVRGGARSAFTASVYKSRNTAGSVSGAGRGFHPYRPRGGRRGHGGAGGGSRGGRSYWN